MSINSLKRDRPDSVDTSFFHFTELPENVQLEVLKKLDIPDLAHFSLASRDLRVIANDPQVWRIIARVIDCPLNKDEPIFSQVKSFIRELRKTALSFIVFHQTLSMKTPTIAAICEIQHLLKLLKAKDAVVVWTKMAEFADLPMPNIAHLTDSNEVLALAEEFPAWCEKNRDLLADAPFDDEGEPMADEDLDWNFNSQLNLSNGTLRTVPKEICYLVRMERLNLANNRLLKLPDFIGEMSHLHSLRLQGNQLSELPSSLAKLPHLVDLNIGNNKFTVVPEVVRSHPKLVNLLLDNNLISFLPLWIFDFEELEQFSFAGNALSELPKRILKFLRDSANQIPVDLSTSNFTLWFSLAKRLNCPLNENEYDTLSFQIQQFLELLDYDLKLFMKSFPEDIINRLNSFTVEDIIYIRNWLKARDTLVLRDTLLNKDQAPLTHSQEYFDEAENFRKWCSANREFLEQITTLDLSDKNLTSLPNEVGYLTNLETLNLSENNLTTLPPELGSLKKLLSLNLNGNRFDSFPRQLCDMVQLQELRIRNLTPPIQICSLTDLRVLELRNGEDQRLFPVIKQSLKKLEIFNGLAKKSAPG